MGNKNKKDKKKDKKLKKADKKERKALFESLKGLVPTRLKSECCEKYLKAESKRCRRCPCFDKVGKEEVA